MAVERVDGVVEARFSYGSGSGVVTYDPGRVDPQVFIEELEEMTGFQASVREGH